MLFNRIFFKGFAMETLREEAKIVPIKGCYDVIVAGGGIAGIAAAINFALA